MFEQPRSQKRFDKYLAKAESKRNTMLLRGNFSLETEVGRLAIVVSKVADHHSAAEHHRSKKEMDYDDHLRWQIEIFEEEAELIKSQQTVLGKEARIYSATNYNLKYIFANETISDVTLIGHGSINTIWCNDPKRNFDWRSVSAATTHLKTGRIEQRMCGHFPAEKGMNLPFGTFAVVSLGQVYAATGRMLPNTIPENTVFDPVFQDEIPLRQQIVDLNEKYSIGFIQDRILSRSRVH